MGRSLRGYLPAVLLHDPDQRGGRPAVLLQARNLLAQTVRRGLFQHRDLQQQRVQQVVELVRHRADDLADVGQGFEVGEVARVDGGHGEVLRTKQL